jgi:hypothetical protein
MSALCQKQTLACQCGRANLTRPQNCLVTRRVSDHDAQFRAKKSGYAYGKISVVSSVVAEGRMADDRPYTSKLHKSAERCDVNKQF